MHKEPFLLRLFHDLYAIFEEPIKRTSMKIYSQGLNFNFWVGSWVFAFYQIPINPDAVNLETLLVITGHPTALLQNLPNIPPWS